MFKRYKYLKLSLSIILSVYIIDQVTKYIIYKTLVPYQSIKVISGLFNIVYAKNLGAAFSLFANTASWFRVPFFIIVPIIAIFIIIILLKKSTKKDSKLAFYEVVSFSLILGGAIGNFSDRIVYGYVIDFLDIYLGSYHWPTFNVADIAITVAIILLFIAMNFNDRSKKRINKEQGTRIPN